MKIVFISGMLPSGHFSQILTSGIAANNKDLIIYADKDRDNLKIKNCGKIKLVWDRSPIYIWQILRELKKDKPDIVHLQQELNMYGGLSTVVLFPLLVIGIKLLGVPLVVTLHASVFKKQIDHKFTKLFHKEGINPSLLKFFFDYLFRSVSLFADSIVVHSNLSKKILTTDYGVSVSKTTVIPCAIPHYRLKKYRRQPYFFYFGYMVRRKGLSYALDGFARFLKKYPKSKYKLVLAGGVIKGQEKALDEIKSFIAKNKLENKVEILGFQNQSDLPPLYGKATAVIIPAVISMGSSGPLYHANSFHKCIITTDIGHFKEDIDQHVTGIRVANNRWHEAFELVANNAKMVKQIEKNVATKALSRTPKKTGKKYLKLYQSVINH